jgi:hypothetical protein
VIDGYVTELARVLSADGVAFIHHSNLAACTNSDGGECDVPNPGHRGTTVSARFVRRLCGNLGLNCTTLELVGWGDGRVLTDCFATITRSGSKFDGPVQVWRNEGFMYEVAIVRQIDHFYSPHAAVRRRRKGEPG